MCVQVLRLLPAYSQRVGRVVGEEVDGTRQDVNLRQVEQRVHNVDARVVQRDERVGVHLVDLCPEIQRRAVKQGCEQELAGREEPLTTGHVAAETGSVNTLRLMNAMRQV